MSAALSPQVSRLIDLAIDEDLGSGDVTTNALVPLEATGLARIVAREDLILSGLVVASEVFRRVEPSLLVSSRSAEGEAVAAGSTVMTIEGPLGAILSAERTALNFLQRLCGIASLTRKYVSLLEGSRTRLLDTRKTTPGWRSLEKAAVRHGGAYNHRFALFDGILIKDNHLLAVGDLASAVGLAGAKAPALLKIEVEVEDLDGLEAAIAAGADIVMLDNMDDDALREAVRIAGGRVLLEASGGIELARLPGMADIGLDFISCGAITHSAPAADLSLDLDDAGLCPDSGAG